MEHYIRKGDALILVCQNNNDSTLLIQEVNPIFAEMTGYLAEELEHVPLKEILGVKMREFLDDYLEYEDDANDMQQVFSKVQQGDFSLKHKDGHEIRVNCKVVRSNAYDQHHWFRLIIRDDKFYREEDAKRSILFENFRGYEKIDGESLLPDLATLQKDLELVQHYVASNELSAIYVLVRIDDYHHMMSFGKENALRTIKHVSSTLRRNLRQDDRICRVSDDTIGMILTDISIESARVVLNRLRWQVVSDRMRIKDGVSTSLNVSVAYINVVEEKCEDIMERCKEQLEQIKTPNAMLEVA